MIAKIKVEKPVLKCDFDGSWELSFKVGQDSVFSAKNAVIELKNNIKPLQIELGFETKKRTLDQNALLWELLTEFAIGLNGGRKGEITTEDLYYKMLNRYGVDELRLVLEGTEKSLKRLYRKVYIIDKVEINGQMWSKCRCVLGSSKYKTQEFSNLIEGILDDMAEAGIETEQSRFLENQWRDYERARNKV